MSKINKSEKEKRARDTSAILQFLNIKLLPVEGDYRYESLVNDLAVSKLNVKLRGVIYLTMTDAIKLDKDLYQINFLQFTDLDPDGFVNKATKEDTTNPFDYEAGGNKKRIAAYVSINLHRVIIIKGSISINSIKKYFDESVPNLLLSKGLTDLTFDSVIEKSRNMLNALREMYSVTKLEVNFTYSNKGHYSDMKKMLDDGLTNSGSKSADIKLVGSKKSPLNLKDDSLPTALIEICESNGDVRASVIEHEGEKQKPFNTEEYVKEEPIKYNNHNFVAMIISVVTRLFG